MTTRSSAKLIVAFEAQGIVKTERDDVELKQIEGPAEPPPDNAAAPPFNNLFVLPGMATAYSTFLEKSHNYLQVDAEDMVCHENDLAEEDSKRQSVVKKVRCCIVSAAVIMILSKRYLKIFICCSEYGDFHMRM